MEFDLTKLQPPRRTVVVAQVYRPDRPGVDTVLRVYEPPMLLVRTTGAAIEARPVEIGERAVVGGACGYSTSAAVEEEPDGTGYTEEEIGVRIVRTDPCQTR